MNQIKESHEIYKNNDRILSVRRELESFEKFIVTKEGGFEFDGREVSAVAFGMNGMIGWPFSENSKPVKFEPNRGHPVIFFESDGVLLIRTSKVSSYYEEAGTIRIITKNSTYNLKRTK